MALLTCKRKSNIIKYNYGYLKTIGGNILASEIEYYKQLDKIGYIESSEMLEKLSLDSDPQVRIRVGYNSHCPINTLEKLMIDENEKVSSKIKEHIALGDNEFTLSLLEQLAQDKKPIC